MGFVGQSPGNGIVEMEFTPDDVGLDELSDTLVISIVWIGNRKPKLSFSEDAETWEVESLLRAATNMMARYNASQMRFEGESDDDDEDDDDD